MKETNMEHYRSEIEAVIEKGCGFGLFDGEIESCHECRSCGFSDSNNAFDGKHTCSSRRIGWLMSEYKPEPMLTAREKHFVECIEDGWLTKSKANTITWWEKKPSRNGKHGWIVIDTGGCVMLQEIHLHTFGDLFPFITWEDEEPWSVEELRELKVEE